MHFEIAERLRPFSHLPGSYFMVPGSSLRLQIYPALIRISDLAGSEPIELAEIPLSIHGPLEEFTISQDLEKGGLSVWGKSVKGFLRYHIWPEGNSKISIYFEKYPGGSKPLLSNAWNGMTVLDEKPKIVPRLHEQLSLGNHKSQDGELMRRRQDFKEIFPLWLRLGQLAGKFSSGTGGLLAKTKAVIQSGQRLELLPHFRLLYLAGFDYFLSPRLRDTDFQGISIPVTESKNISPLEILTEGATLIRSLFLQENDSGISILPALPPEYHCGRLLNAVCRFGWIDMEWSKKAIRRLSFRAGKNANLLFSFQKEIKRCRIRRHATDRGIYIDRDVPLEIREGEIYWFDNFKR